MRLGSELRLPQSRRRKWRHDLSRSNPKSNKSRRLRLRNHHNKLMFNNSRNQYRSRNSLVTDHKCHSHRRYPMCLSSNRNVNIQYQTTVNNCNNSIKVYRTA